MRLAARIEQLERMAAFRPTRDAPMIPTPDAACAEAFEDFAKARAATTPNEQGRREFDEALSAMERTAT